MPSVMERSGAGVLSRSRAKTVTNGNSQPHSEEESSDEEHAHGTHVHTYTLFVIVFDLSDITVNVLTWSINLHLILAGIFLPAVPVACIALLQCSLSSPLFILVLCPHTSLLPSFSPSPTDFLLIFEEPILR